MLYCLFKQLDQTLATQVRALYPKVDWDGLREWDWLSVAPPMAEDPGPQPSSLLQNT